jgi:hypothetical protein
MDDETSSTWRSAKCTAEAHPHASWQFYKVALEYYVSGRAAVLCHSSLVAGNLFHHAIEMLLKGFLSKTIPLEDLKNPKKFGHNLPRLWTTFSGLFGTEDLAEFNSVIDELEKFETIRYPDKILEQGAHIGFGFGRGKVLNILPGQTVPVYQTGVGDVDALFARLLPLCEVDPEVSFNSLSPFGWQVLTEKNAASNDWVE